MPTTTRAQVMWEPDQWWDLVELELDDPKDHEVLIRFEVSGLCHSDDHVRTGDARCRYPMVGGHEGAGVIEQVGPNVARVGVGDRVVCSYIPMLLGPYRSGDLKLDELISNRYRLAQVNDGYQDLLDGKNIRGVVLHEH